jgi:hypothetical protein
LLADCQQREGKQPEQHGNSRAATQDHYNSGFPAILGWADIYSVQSMEAAHAITETSSQVAVASCYPIGLSTSNGCIDENGRSNFL